MKIDLKKIKDFAKELYDYLQPECIAIYLGGSHCQEYIKNPHDIDIICFSNLPKEKNDIRRKIYSYQKNHNLDIHIDLFQIRCKEKEEHSYGSYIHKDMILLAGEEITFTFDPIYKNRKEYINILLDTINKLNEKIILNQKRWYQIFRGYFLLINNNYDLTEEQKEIINKAHDKTEEFLELREEVYNYLIKEINNEILLQ